MSDVAEALADDLGWNSSAKADRGVSVSKVVKANARKLELGDHSLEGLRISLRM